MKKLFLFIIVIFFFQPYVAQDFDAYQKTWATYFGGSGTYFHNIFIDSEENLIAIGQLTYINFTNDDEAYYNQFVTSDDPQFQYHSGVFFQTLIAKFSPEGNLLWSGYLPFLTYSSKIDSNDQIYIIGSTENSALGTSGVWLEEPLYSSAEGLDLNIAAKLNSDFTIDWLSYLPIESYVFMDISENGEMYCSGSTSINEDITTTGVFQTDFLGDDNNGFLVKLDYQGNLDWATYNGISKVYAIHYSKNGILLHAIKQTSDNEDYYITEDAYQDIPTNKFISLFNPQSGNRIYSTFFDEKLLPLSFSFREGYYYFFGQTLGTLTDENLISENAFQTEMGDAYNYFIGKFDFHLNPIWGTYIGGDQAELALNSLSNPTLEIKNESLYFTGPSLSDNFFTSPNPYQSNNNGKEDLLLMKFNLDGDFIWGSFFGGPESENFGNLVIKDEETFYLVGSTISKTAISTPEAYQENLNKHPNINDSFEHPNGFIAKFSPDAPLSVISPQQETLIVYPNPTNSDLYIRGMSPGKKQIHIFNSLGQKVFSEEFGEEEEIYLNLQEMNSGIYFLEISNFETAHNLTKKIIIY